MALCVLFPLGAAALRVHLALPDGHARLQSVDGVRHRLQRVAPVTRADGDHDGRLADRHHTQPAGRHRGVSYATSDATGERHTVSGDRQARTGQGRVEQGEAGLLKELKYSILIMLTDCNH